MPVERKLIGMVADIASVGWIERFDLLVSGS